MHVPVLINEIIEHLVPKPGGVYLDGTLGDGGYSRALLDASKPDGSVIGLDLDPDAVARAAVNLDVYGDRFRAVHGGFHEAPAILEGLGTADLDGAVLDLGLSSDQLMDPERGFGIQSDGPLDMRFDTTSGETAMDLLRNLSVRGLEDILERYGEEPRHRRVARAVMDARDRGLIRSAKDLAGVVNRAVGRFRGRIHPATRTFQALRIAVNHELKNVEKALDVIPTLLKVGGRLCVVSYHSLEDRLVKLSFRARKAESESWLVVFPKPLRPGREEVLRNPRSRSAKMRVLERR
ncbi:MAG: 16S rRNA (cytosine(1402)-N(4))-methyltransferase RsmH [Pseudomonadota bacterium]